MKVKIELELGEADDLALLQALVQVIHLSAPEDQAPEMSEEQIRRHIL